MAQVVAFPAFAPRTALSVRADGDRSTGKIIVFTGVWHERVENDENRPKPGKPEKRKK